MKRTPLKRKTPLRVTRTKDPDQEWWAEVKAIVLARSASRCEGQVSEHCRVILDFYGVERHHRKLRSQGGSHAIVNIVALCPACHRWVHNHPEKARARGLICPRYHDPATWGLTLPDGRVVTLTSEGDYQVVLEPPVIDGEAS